jgi:hypothetical protein
MSTDKKIAESDPKVEHNWIKWPRERPIDVSAKSYSNEVFIDDKKVKDEYASHNRPYTDIHTHPDVSDLNFVQRMEYEGGELDASVLPNARELPAFTKDSRAKTMVVVQRNVKTGERLGKIVIKKPKNFKPTSYDISDLEKSEKMARETGSVYSWREEFEKAVNGYGLRYRFVPNKGYEVKDKEVAFTKQISPLEQRVAASILIVLSLSALLFSNNITGFSIFNSQLSNLSVYPLIIILIIFLYYLVKINRKKIKCEEK